MLGTNFAGHEAGTTVHQQIGRSQRLLTRPFIRLTVKPVSLAL
jgi:hypothetical protein